MANLSSDDTSTTDDEPTVDDPGTDIGTGSQFDNADAKSATRTLLSALGLFGLIQLVADTETAEQLAGEGGLLKDPVGFIEGVIVDWLYDQIVRPIAVSIWDTGVAIGDGILFTFFGGDYALGVTENTTVGILDVPFLITGPIGAAALDLGGDLQAFIVTVNQPLVDSMSQFGIIAPFVGPIVILTELMLVGWTMYIIVSAIDVPLVRIMPAIKTAMTPFTRLLRWLFR